MAANIRIIKLGLGRCPEQIAINPRRHIAVTIDGAVNELDFERVKSLTITDCDQGVGMDRLTRNSGSDLALFCRRCAVER